MRDPEGRGLCVRLCPARVPLPLPPLAGAAGGGAGAACSAADGCIIRTSALGRLGAGHVAPAPPSAAVAVVAAPKSRGAETEATMGPNGWPPAGGTPGMPAGCSSAAHAGSAPASCDVMCCCMLLKAARLWGMLCGAEGGGAGGGPSQLADKPSCWP